MTQRIRLTPNICYMLGVYSCSYKRDQALIEMESEREEFLDRFIKIAIGELAVAPNRLLVRREDRRRLYIAGFYHSKLKRFMDNSMERRDRIFKYRNEHTANYFAGLFDRAGGCDSNGMYLYRIGNENIILMERFGLHTSNAIRTRVRNESAFIMLISKYSLRMQSIVHQPGNERDLR